MTAWLLVMDGPLDGAGDEALRIAVGALAADARVDVVASAAVMDAIEAGELSSSADDYVEVLQDSGGTWMRFQEANLPDLLRGATHVIRHGAPNRSGIPPLYVIDDEALTASDAEITRSLREAGQVVRTARR